MSEHLTLSILLVSCISFLIFFLILSIRNGSVYRERMKVHDKIFEKDNDNRYKRSGQITALIREQDAIATYSDMVWKFWKPVNSFYAEFMERLESED